MVATGLIALACPPVSAGPPTDRLREFFADVNAVLADPATDGRPLERVARIRRLVSEVTDMQSAAATALGADWDERTAAEREEFIELFAELLERAYVGRIAGAVRVTGRITMRFGAEAGDAGSATVTAALRGLGGTDAHVEYRLTAHDGRWRVRDIALDGVSVVENYRAQFKRLRQRSPYRAVVAAMRAKIAGESLMFAGSQRGVPAATAAVDVKASPAASPPPVIVDEPRPASPPPASPPPVVRTSVRPAAEVRATPARPRHVPDTMTVGRVVAASAPPVPAIRAEPARVVPASATPSSSLVGTLALGLVAIGGAIRMRGRSAPARTARHPAVP